MAERMLMKGNEALAEAAIRAGCRCFFGYPITPQSEIAAYMSKRLTRMENGVYLQAESEIAAINMVLGAAASGFRAMTSSSSPGISLKSEGISYIAGCDLPCVIVNVQRAGPGLGGIQPAQTDYWQATRGFGHGGARVFVFAPSSIQETVDIVYESFEISEKYRIPAIVFTDGLLGQMMEPVVFEERKAEPAQKTWAVTGHKNSRVRNVINSLYLEASELEIKINEREGRYREVQRNEVRIKTRLSDDAEIGIVAYGSTARVADAAVDTARENGIKAGLIRPVTLWPFPSREIEAFASRMSKILVVEMSSGQMVEDVRLAVNGRIPVEFYGRTGGVVPTPAEIFREISRLMKGGE